MLNLVREGEEDHIEAIRYRRRLKIFENFLLSKVVAVIQTTSTVTKNMKVTLVGIHNVATERNALSTHIDTTA